MSLIISQIVQAQLLVHLVIVQVLVHLVLVIVQILEEHEKDIKDINRFKFFDTQLSNYHNH